MKATDNRITSTFYLLLTCLASLSLISFIPDSFFESHDLKKTDYIGPVVLVEEIPVPEIEKLKIENKPLTKAKVKKIPEGVIPIEDYSKDGHELSRLVNGLHHIKASSGNFRIAFFGDSFIEGDIITMDLRDSLQNTFGGQGIGFLPVSSEVSMFRKSLPSESENWKVLSLNGKSLNKDLGINGAVCIPQDNASLKLHPNKALHQIDIICKNNNNTTVKILKNSTTHVDTIPQTENLTRFQLSNNNDTIRKFKISIPEGDGLLAYGLDITNGKGIYLDNYSVRGNSGLGLKSISDEQFVEFQNLMNYKLIVLQFGLNAAYANTKDFSNYEKNMVKMINHLKELFPETSILLLSTSDRSHKEGGNFTTMPSIPLLVEAQKRIAKESQILFWNMYEAMGGENSMVDFVKNKNANKDYTHLNFNGGKIIADKLYKALMFEYNHYEKTHEQSSLAIW